MDDKTLLRIDSLLKALSLGLKQCQLSRPQWRLF